LPGGPREASDTRGVSDADDNISYLMQRSKGMKKVRMTILTGVFVTWSAAVFAAEGRVDDSHLLTYIFLAVCGLIVIFQLVPVASLVKDLFKGMKKESNELKKANASVGHKH